MTYSKGKIGARHSLAELEALPTLEQGQADDLKIATPERKVWLSRCGVEDGEPCNNKVTIEELVDGRWTEVGWYEATNELGEADFVNRDYLEGLSDRELGQIIHVGEGPAAVLDAARELLAARRLDQLRADCDYDPDGEGSVDNLIAYKDALEDLIGGVLAGRQLRVTDDGELTFAAVPDEVQVWYSVPIACHVNVEKGPVERVVVIDEEVKLEPQPKGGVTLADYSDAAPADVAKRAVEVAESEAWPVWEHGY